VIELSKGSMAPISFKELAQLRIPGHVNNDSGGM